ncbi:MAG: hypothetical protein HY293_03540 [Planctomycetes bacterium]|nr:hypothetical protein [Planctomycetota bacterium]
MRNAGLFLILLGATTFIFPLFNRHSMILGVFGEHEKIAAIVSLAAGAVLIGLSFRKKKEEKK